MWVPSKYTRARAITSTKPACRPVTMVACHLWVGNPTQWGTKATWPLGLHSWANCAWRYLGYSKMGHLFLEDKAKNNVVVNCKFQKWKSNIEAPPTPQPPPPNRIFCAAWGPGASKKCDEPWERDGNQATLFENVVKSDFKWLNMLNWPMTFLDIQ